MYSGLDILYSQTDFPIKMISRFGVILLILSIIAIIATLIPCLILKSYYVMMILIIIFALMLVLGICLISIGVVDNYIVRIYTESKHRPLYFVRETINKN